MAGFWTRSFLLHATCNKVVPPHQGLISTVLGSVYSHRELAHVLAYSLNRLAEEINIINQFHR